MITFAGEACHDMIYITENIYQITDFSSCNLAEGRSIYPPPSQPVAVMTDPAEYERHVTQQDVQRKRI